MSEEIKKVVRDGKVAVLYSPGFGAGWYTWNEDVKQCLFSPEIVAILEEGRKVTDEDCEKIFGERFYAGGAKSLKIEWIPEGTRFEINDYDGHETIYVAEKLTEIA